MKFSIAITGIAAFVAIPLALADDSINLAALANRYIVKYKDNADPSQKQTFENDINTKAKKNKKGGVLSRYDMSGFQGYLVEILSSDLDNIASSNLVESIEKDGVVNISTVVAGPAVVKRTQITQKPAPWNLARISHRNNGPADYTYDNTAGQGVRVYVIDTGIQITHQEFEGRAVWGANFVSGSQNTDENGHGTHVSGTVGGKNFGVAKQATLVAVKVLDAGGSGSISGVISGIQWAVNDAINKRVAPKSVINMSLGGSVSSQLNSAVLAATNAGLTVAVAAGNSNVNASTFSPASAPSAITVAATDGTDVRAWFSNWGAVDIFAPGESVLSSWTGGSNSEARYLAGTSMASPHIAGLAAYFIAAEGLSGSSAVTNRILGAATPGIVGDPRGSPNLFAYNADGL